MENHGTVTDVVEPQVLTPKRTEYGKAVRKQYEAHDIKMSRHDMTTMTPRTDGVCNTLTSVQKDNLVAEPRSRIRKLTPRECFRLMGATIEETKTNNFMEQERKSITLPEELQGKKFRIRKLTPKECFRLMGVDDADIAKIQASGISNSAQYKLAGNSIVVDVLYHLFRKMFVETEPDKTNEPQQLSLF